MLRSHVSGLRADGTPWTGAPDGTLRFLKSGPYEVSCVALPPDPPTSRRGTRDLPLQTAAMATAIIFVRTSLRFASMRGVVAGVIALAISDIGGGPRP